MNLALFDFDGTITFKDSFAPFIRLALNHPDAPTGTIRLAPLVIGYKAGLVSATVAREKVSWSYRRPSMSILRTGAAAFRLN